MSADRPSGPRTVHDLPPLDRAAFLLDFDGTLVDIAPTPDSVIVAPTLPSVLRRLRAACGDALGIVTGRPIAQLDSFLPDIPYAVAGEHGVAMRVAPGEAIRRAVLPEFPAEWLVQAEQMVAAHLGAMLERKRTGLVLHYRAAPEAGAVLRESAQAMLDGDPAHRYHLGAAKMAWEIRPAGIDKGSAVQALMRLPPFAGRLPVFVGDDVTDEDGIHAAQALGGVGFRIPDDFPTPADFRDWLASLVEASSPEPG